MRLATTTGIITALIATASWAQSPTPATAASSPIYKWIDASGTVNYASKPPKGQEAARVDLSESRLNVVSATKVSATLASQQAGTDRLARARIDALEDELQRERSNRSNEVQRDEQMLTAWRDRCNRERFTDCDDNLALSARYGGRFASPVPGYGYAYGGPGYIVQQVPIVRAQRPFDTVPTPPSAVPKTPRELSQPPAEVRRTPR
ncbi:MAG: DUF4124 domain-containing protein [Burkholderiales bacterium]